MQSLNLSSNQLTGAIPPELGNLSFLQTLLLQYNQLTGAIPAEFGNLAYLKSFSLYKNQLSGEIPPTLLNLTNLYDNQSDLRYNCLSTTDDALRAFLDSKQEGGDWESTQCLIPEPPIPWELFLPAMTKKI